MTTPVPIQLALQGGGARFTHLIAALHAVQDLERENVLRVTRIAGTSAGALAGALYAARVDMGRARDVLLSEHETLLRAFPASGGTLRDTWRVLARRPLWDAEPLRRLLARLLSPRETFRDLDLPLIVLAADLTNLQSVVYGRPDDPLLSSIMDSAAVPFLFRAVPRKGEDYRVVVDGGVCDNLPSEQLADSPVDGEVLGITFSVPRAGAPLATFSDYLRALVETAINASVLRAQLQLGLNAFVIRAATRAFDFRGAIEAAGGAEYRETQLLADAHFRAYAGRTATTAAAGARKQPGGTEARGSCLRRIEAEDAAASLRRMYEHRHEPVHFDFLSIRMIVTGASHASIERRGPDHIRHEIVFRATTQPLHCYRIQLASGDPSELHKTHCELFDVDGDPVPFDIVPIGERGAREYLLFFGTPVVPGDPRAPLTLRVRDALTDGLRLARDGRDELVVRASRADRPIGRIEIIAHLPEELSDTRVVAAPSSVGMRMAPAELLGYAAPAGYFTLGWRGEDIPPGTLFGCNLIRR
ncbi:MAG TPA: patatin-like phospholipase family protein [Thermoanaerobaculia bacterium]|nr:patatin-like phospholipase family protein [Thermoanaerobaculia bacterium]